MGTIAAPPAHRKRATAPHWPLISVVTCSFQQGRYLEHAMRSVLEQDYPHLEYIVVDGGSTDGSADIIRRYQHALDYWVSEPDRGQTHALVKGFARATGEIHGWLCSDDLMLPGALDAVARYFRAHPEVMAVYGDAIWIDAEGRYLRPKKEMGFSRFVFLHDHNYVPQPSMFWRRALYDAAGGLDPSYELAMDADLWERFSEHTRIAHLPRFLSCMRSYPEQKTRSRRLEGRREDRTIRARRVHSLARGPVVAAFLRWSARCVRVLAKACAGGYMARVPVEHRVWLERLAAEAAET